MSQLLSNKPYQSREQELFLAEMNELCRHHRQGCPEYGKIWPAQEPAQKIEELPFLHVGLFKRIGFKTDLANGKRERMLKSSATTGTTSNIALDTHSSRLQAQSTEVIFKDFLGEQKCPLIIIDSARSLRSRGEISARVAAALSLRSLSSEMYFILEDAQDPSSIKWNILADILTKYSHIRVYGFTWILWLAWTKTDKPKWIKQALQGKTIHFIHSGGWKKLETYKITPQDLEKKLLVGQSPQSMVLDFYGLVEQVGIIYPMCPEGFRHAPAWADVIVRDFHTLEPLIGQTGQLQLLNSLAWGAPYHSVLTEDIGKIVPGECRCSRAGTRFILEGRIPHAEIRGCANV